MLILLRLGAININCLKRVYYIQTEQPDFTYMLKNTMLELIDKSKEPLFLCIGTDRSTGDALGPLVGKGLKKCGFMVLGTLDEPVHAVNIFQSLDNLEEIRGNRQIVAIDAGLGRNVGCVSLWKGSLQPGAGIRKQLPRVGDVSIMGTVAKYCGNSMENLQNVRLGMVVNMAENIVEGIRSVYM